MRENRMNVFLIDDEETIVCWLAKNIEWENYGCKVVGSATVAEKALEFIERNPVEVLVTDIHMPGMSGLELIRRVKRIKPDIHIIVLSAYDKFEYVKEAFRYGIIDYCLKPIDVNEINNCLKTVELAYKEEQINSKKQDISIFRNSIFQRLINGVDNSLRLTEQCKLADLSLDEPVCQIALIDIMQMEKSKCANILELFNNLALKGMYVFLDGHMNVVVLFFGDAELVESNVRKISELPNKEAILKDAFFVIGKPLQSYREIAESYNFCSDFSMASCLFEDRVIFTDRYHYEKYLQVIKGGKRQQFLNLLQTGSCEKIMQLVRQIVSAGRTECERREELICLMVFTLKNISVLEPLKKISMPGKKFTSLSTSKEMMEWMEAFFWNMTNGDNTFNENLNYNQHVNKALNEIRLHYGDSMFSIQSVAKTCHVSPAYLGKIFREQTGEFFNDYLLKVRMLEAEKLLFDNVLRIGDIAERVGFSNQSYFNKMFRKVYGISPREYRYRCQEEL